VSVNLNGLTPARTLRFGGQVDWDDPVQIPNGLAILCQNMQFLAESVKTRWGLRAAASLPSLDADPTGVDVLTVLGNPTPPGNQQASGGSSRLNPQLSRPVRGIIPVTNPQAGDWQPIPGKSQVAVVFTSTGELLLELPAGSGTLVPVNNTRIAASIIQLLATFTNTVVMQTSKAYNRIYMAFTDLKAAIGPVLALDAATGYVCPVPQNPVAAAWQPNTLYFQGDIVTPTANPNVWFRRTQTGLSGANEPGWPGTLTGFFEPTYEPTYAQAADNNVLDAWEEWTPGFPAYLPTPSIGGTITPSAGGTLPAGDDIYLAFSYFNSQGESTWIYGIKFYNPNANQKITFTFQNNLCGPSMPRWLMAVMGLGDTNGLHWPAQTCLNVYVNAVAHNAAAPTQYYLYEQTTADRPVVVSSVPGSGTLYPIRTAPTASISGQQFKGEPGTRFAVLLRQDVMGNLSPVDPNAPQAVSFAGGFTDSGQISVAADGSFMYIQVDDVTQYAAGMTLDVNCSTQADWTGSFTIVKVIPGFDLGADPLTTTQAPVPQGTLTFSTTGLTPNPGGTDYCKITVLPGACPVAVVPPGSQEGPGYTYDVLALTSAGLSSNGPFNYLANPEPAVAASASVISETIDGAGNAFLSVSTVAGLTAGDDVLIAGYAGGLAVLNGLRVLASVSSGNSAPSVTLPDPNGAQTQTPAGVTISVVQSQPTLVASGTVGILLQFDDTTLAEGVDVTGNLLFIAVPEAIDLSYIPSIDRMAYVSDSQPTSVVFSEETFLGEVDGENDVLNIEPTDGSILVGVRELLNGMVVACKEEAGYQVVPTADVPARWGVNRLWGNHGPWSGRNIATGRDASSKLSYIIFVDPESGVYRYPPILGQGELDWLSKELSGANNQDASRMATWDRVNRAAGEQIQVVIDDIAKEIKIAVPLDGAATPNYVLTMSYFNGWQDPLMLTLSGEWIANRQSRRWNLDPIPTRCMALVKRTLAVPVDQRVNRRQLLLGTPASINNNGCALTFMQPGAYDDLGAGYTAKYRPAYSREAPNPAWPAGGRLLRFSAVTGHAIGSGIMAITPITPSPEFSAQPILQSLDEGEAEVPGSAPVTHFTRGPEGDGEFLTHEFSNQGKPGAWFQLMEYVAWYKAKFPTR